MLDIFPAHEEDHAVRIIFFGDEIENIQEIDPLTGKLQRALNRVTIYPATHYVTTVDIREKAIRNVKKELKQNYLICSYSKYKCKQCCKEEGNHPLRLAVNSHKNNRNL